MLPNRWSERTMIRGALAATAILFAFAVSSPAQEAGTLRIPPDQWQYHAGDDMRCAAIADAACTWQPPPKEGFGGNTFYWKHAVVTLSDDLRKTPQIGLIPGDTILAFEIYANGRLIDGTGKTGFYDAGPAPGGFLTFPTSLAPDGRLVLAVRSFPQWRARSLGTPLPYVLAPADLIQTVTDAETFRYLRSNAAHYLCFAVVGFAGFVFLLLYSVNRRLWENFWLGVIFLDVATLRVLEISPIVHLWMPAWLGMPIYLLANSLMPLFQIEFVFSFLKRPVPSSLRLVQILGFADFCFATRLPLPHLLAWIGTHGTSAAILLSQLTLLLMLPSCFRSRLPEMRWIGASALFFTLENAARMARQLGLPSPNQDVMWHGRDIDIRGIAFLLFALVMLIAMTFRLRRIQNRNREIEQEMAEARGIQQILIPDQLPQVPGLAIESAYLPAQEVGGDFFQILPIPHSADPVHPSTFIVLGDVSGKGLKAAMTVSMIVGTLRAYAETCTSPAELLAGLNRRLYGRSDGFTTCLALMIEPSGKVSLANAAHCNPYLDGKEVHTEANLPLGLTLDVIYTEIDLQLEGNHRLTLVTDGVVEATSAKNHELFGFDRTQAISNQSANSIAEAARNFGDGAPQDDDITVLSVTRTIDLNPAMA